MSTNHLEDDDAFSLLGYAAFLDGQGQTEMPAHFRDMARRIALSIGNEALAARIVEIASAEGAQLPEAHPTPDGAGV